MKKKEVSMLQLIETINNAVNNFIWGVPAMICIFGVGLYLSLRTRFLQIRKFPYAIRTTLGRMFRKRDASDGAITPFQAVCTALAATVGTGNIAGVAGAIAIGGPGAVFWMWVSALLGMCTKFAEVTLAVFYHEKNANGELVGGPMYYIKNGLSKKWHFLAYLFAAFGVLTVFGTGNATQVNTITTAVNSALMNYHVISKDAIPTSNLIQGIIIAVLVALILLGGVKRIAQVTEKLVPFMALFYIVLAIGVILLNLNRIPSVFVSILEGAFRPSAVTGGIVGSMLMSVKIGYPDKWRDYSGLEIKDDSYWANVRRSNIFDMAYQLADVDKPVDKSRWHMNPQTVNAYYNPTTNEICLPAAILQPPFFNPDADDAVNYGAIGVVIGHEMTHGFDDQGRNYDKDGNLIDWWTAEDAVRFKERADKLVDQYDQIIVIDTLHANGRFTLGENIADHGGLLVAHQAYLNSLKGKETPAPIDGFTNEQRFFLGYATLWGQNIRPEEIRRRTKIDPHSLGKWRVNAALRNIAPFYAAFDIKEGDPMFMAPADRVVIW